MGFFFTVFIQPVYNLLVLLASILPLDDLGFAIIGLTVIVKGALFPLTYKTMKSQREMQALQPKIADIRATYKDDKETMSKELMKVYKDHKVNPFGSCLPLLVQIPIFLAIFRVLQGDFTSIHSEVLYDFVVAPEAFNTMFLGLVDLTKVFIPFAVVAAALQYWQVRTSLPPKPVKEAGKTTGTLDEEVAANMQRMMLYFIPAITLLVGSTTLPAGVMIYWIMSTVITVALNKIFLPKKVGQAGDMPALM